jgi:hypothetical protein
MTKMAQNYKNYTKMSQKLQKMTQKCTKMAPKSPKNGNLAVKLPPFYCFFPQIRGGDFGSFAGLVRAFSGPGGFGSVPRATAIDSATCHSH